MQVVRQSDDCPRHDEPAGAPARRLVGFDLAEGSAAGTVAKVNLALSALPSFAGVTDAAMLGGRVHLGPDIDYLERAFDHAKYGEYSTWPWLDLAIPSVLDRSLAPAGAHVMSIYVHYAP